MARQFALSCDSISLGLQARSEGSGDKWLTHKVKISTSSVAIGPCIHHYKNGSPSNLSAKRRIKGMGRRFRIWMMTHLGYDNPTSLQVSFPQKFTQSLLITLQAAFDQKQLATKQEEIAHDVAMIQSVERDFRQNISSAPPPGTLQILRHKPAQPPAQSLAVQ